MKRLVLVLAVGCAEEKDAGPTCESLQLSKQELGECVVDADPRNTDGCPFALGGFCYPNGSPEDCDAQLADLVGIGCNLDNTNCHYGGLPQCETISETKVRFGARMVRDGVRGIVILDDQSTIEKDHCTFVPCQ